MNRHNIDQHEIDKFSRLFDQWWNSKGDLRTLHHINPVRLAYFLEHLSFSDKSDLSTLTVLDIGCGGGIFSESLAKAGAKVVGIDPDKQAIEVAQKHSQENQLSIEYLNQTLEQFKAEHEGRCFDVITCMDMLEHVPEPGKLITACYDLLTPQGQLFLSTLNRHPKAYLLAILGAEYLLKLLPKGTHDYKKFIKPAEINRWAIESGFKLMNLQGFNYNPFSQAAQFSDDMRVNYLACLEKQ